LDREVYFIIYFLHNEIPEKHSTKTLNESTEKLAWFC
jgi:hypothetical protein